MALFRKKKPKHNSSSTEYGDMEEINSSISSHSGISTRTPYSFNSSLSTENPSGNSSLIRSPTIMSKSTIGLAHYPDASVEPGYEHLMKTPEALAEEMEKLIESIGMDEATKNALRNLSDENKAKIIISKRQMAIDEDKVAPDHYIRKFTKEDLRTVGLKSIKSLRVSLSTRPIGWVHQYLELGGFKLISNGILNLAGARNRHVIFLWHLYILRNEMEEQVEYELIKCVSSILNTKWGVREALMTPECIMNVAYSLDATLIHTRKLAVELLTFMCYCEIPKGCSYVLKGMDQVKKARGYHLRFETWLKSLEATIDGRGILGSLVKASEEIRRAGGADRELVEYVLSNMILLNGILYAYDEVEMRTHLRNQMHAAGLGRVLKKIRIFANDLIQIQLDKFEDLTENDYLELREYCNHQVLKDMSDPSEVFHAVLESVANTKGYSYLLSILQHLLIIRDDENDEENRIKYFELADTLITQMVLDRRGYDQDFSTTYGVSVESVLSRLGDDEKLQLALKSAKEAEKVAEEAVARKNDLELEIAMKSDGLVGILKAKIYSLEDLVRMSRYTIESLENENKEIREQYRSKLTNQATQLKELYLMIRESHQDCENGHSRATTADMNFASDKEQRLQDEVERLKNEQITVRQQMTSLEIQIQQFRQNSQPSLMEHTDQLELLDTEDSDIDYSIHSFISLDHNNPSILEDSDDSWAEESIPTSTPKNDFRQVYRRKGHHKKSTPALSMASDSFRDETGNQDVRKGSTTSISRIDLPSEQRKNIVSESTNILNRVRYNDSPLKAERSSMPVTSSTLLSYVSDEVNTALTTGLSPRNSKPTPFTSISPPPPPPPHQDSLNESALNSTPIASTPPSIVTTPSLDESTPSTPLPSSSILSPGLPPPPPPPPPMSSHTSNSFPPPMPQLKPRKQLKWLPRSKVKQFPWEKIPDFAVERTVWSEKVKEEESLGEEFTTKGVFEEIEEIFSARAIEPIDHDTAKEEKAESKITVLNSKLTHNLMIILGRLRHLSSEKIREAILNLNENILTEILIRQFLQFMPSAEERGLLAEYKETPEKLAKADAFCAEMMKIDRYEQRLRAMHFKQTYFERYIALNEDLSAVLEASEALEKSHQFPKLLEIILVVGNFMNGTSFRGSAYGFKIHSINKLVDTKGKRNQITLLHFLVNTIEQRFPGILRFLDELNPVDAGCRVCFHEMKSNFKELNDQFEETQIEIEKYHSGPDKSQDPFTIQMRGFLASAGEQLSESQTKYERMHVTYEKIVKSYGEDPKTMTPEEFFGIFKSFMTSFEKALKDNRLRREQIERAEKRKHQENAKLDEPIAEKPLESELSVNPSPPTEEEKGVMDSLLDVLRRGNDFNAARRANRTEAISRLRDRDRRRTIRTYRRGSVHTRAKDLLVDLSSDKISRRNTSKSTLSIPALAEDN